MGARATNARWFRTPMPAPEPYDFYAPMIVDRERNRRFLARIKAAGMLPAYQRKIIARALAAPESALGRAVRLLAADLEKRFPAFYKSQSYRDLLQILAESKVRLMNDLERLPYQGFS